MIVIHFLLKNKIKNLSTVAKFLQQKKSRKFEKTKTYCGSFTLVFIKKKPCLTFNPTFEFPNVT